MLSADEGLLMAHDFGNCGGVYAGCIYCLRKAARKALPPKPKKVDRAPPL